MKASMSAVDIQLLLICERVFNVYVNIMCNIIILFVLTVFIIIHWGIIIQCVSVVLLKLLFSYLLFRGSILLSHYCIKKSVEIIFKWLMEMIFIRYSDIIRPDPVCCLLIFDDIIHYIILTFYLLYKKSIVWPFLLYCDLFWWGIDNLTCP